MKVKKHLAVLLALAMILPLSPAVPIMGAVTVPVIFKLSDEIKPGESFYVYGDGLNPEDGSLQVFVDDTTRVVELEILQYDTEGGAFVVAALQPKDPEEPLLAPGLLGLWVKNSAGESNRLLLNEAKPYWIQWDVVYEGLTVELVGANLAATRFGVAQNDTKVRLVALGGYVSGGTDAEIVPTVSGIVEDRPGLEPYNVTFVVPDLPPGPYDVYVTNDGGSHWAMMDNYQGFRIIDKQAGRAGNAQYGIPAGADPLGLGVAWEVNYNYSTVVNVKDYGARGDGSADDTAAINAAMDALETLGGGIAWFPIGDYIVSGSILIPPKTILLGEDRELSRIVYNVIILPTDTADQVRTKNYLNFFQTRWVNDFATGDYQGMKNLTLTITDESILPGMIMWIGDGWSAQFARRFDGFFIKGVNLRFTEEYRGNWAGGGEGRSMVSYTFINKYLLVEDTDQESFRGVINPVFVTYHTSRNNKYRTIASSNESISSYTIFENNDIEMDADFRSDDGYWFGAQGATLRTNYMASHNSIVNTGVYQGNEGEIICSEASHHCVTLCYGNSAKNVNGTGFTIYNPRMSSSRYNPGGAVDNGIPGIGAPTSNFWDQRTDGRPAYGYYVAVIVDGKGVGQSRRVESFQEIRLASSYEFNVVVNKPWDVEPDATSKIYVGTLCDQAFMYSNYTKNCKGPIFFYGGALDSVVADNSGTDTMGIGATGFFVMDEGGNSANGTPTFHVSYLNNHFERASRLTDHLTIYNHLAYESRNGERFGYNMYGFTIKGNTLKDAPANRVTSYGDNMGIHAPQGITFVAQSPFTPNPSALGTALMKGLLIEGNTLENMVSGVTAGVNVIDTRNLGGNPVSGVLIRKNVFNKVTTPITTTGSRNVVIIDNDINDEPVTPVAPWISTTISTLKTGKVGTPYSFQIFITGTKTGDTWSIVNGALPDGLVINADPSGDGAISGTPTQAGVYTFTAKVTNAGGSDEKEFTVAIIDSTLKSLTVSDGAADIALTPAFSPFVLSYIAYVPYSVSSVIVGAEANDALAALDAGELGEKSLEIGANPFTVTVTARDGKSSTQYAFVIYRADVPSVTPPVIFRLTDEVKPGELLYIYGGDLNSANLRVCALDAAADRTYNLPIVQKDTADGAYVAVDLKVGHGGVYQIWVENDNGPSNALLLNAARPQWLQWDIGYAGLPVQVIGVNFDPARFDGTGSAQVRLFDGNNYYSAAVTKAEPYSVTFEVPVNVPAGLYDVEVSNGGEWWASVSSGQKFEIIDKPNYPDVTNPLDLYGPDPLDLGVAWAANYEYARVADVTDPATFGSPAGVTGADKTGAAEATDVVRAAADWLRAQGGGILYFPAGVYRVNTITLPPRTILMGQGQDVTRIEKISMKGSAGVGTRLPLIATMRGGNGISLGDYQGVFGVTLTLTADSDCLPKEFFAIGDAYIRSAPNGTAPYNDPFRFKGFFLKNTVIDIPYKDALGVYLPNNDGGKANSDMMSYGYVDKYLIVEGTTQKGFKGVFDGAAGSYVTVRNNDYKVYYRSDSIAGTYVIEENNSFFMDPGASAAGDVGRDANFNAFGTQGLLLRTNFYAAHNYVAQADGDGWNTAQYADEAIGSDLTMKNLFPGAYWQSARRDPTVEAIGEIMSASGDTIVVNPRRNGSQALQSVESARVIVSGQTVGDPLYGPLLAVITSGKGVGQARRVVSYDAASFAYTLDSPFDITPDATSKVYVGNLAYNSVIYDNSADYCKGGFSFSGGAFDSVIADNRGYAVRGAGNRTIFDLNAANGETNAKLVEAGPSFFVSMLNNNFERQARHQLEMGVFSTVEYRNGDPNGLSQYGLVIKGNVLGGCQEGVGTRPVKEGISVVVLGNVPVNTNMIKGALIENNVLFRHHPTLAPERITLSGAVDGVIVHGNVYKNNKNDLVPAETGQRDLTTEGGATNVVYYEGQSLSDDATLASLEVEGFAIAPAFDPGVTGYTLTVAANVASVTILASASDENAVISGNVGVVSITADVNTFRVIVTAENGDVRTYTIVITRQTPVFVVPVKSMLAKVAKLQHIPYTYDGPGPLEFKTSNPAVCGVTQDGVLVPMKAGIAVITVTAPGFPNYIFAVTVSA